MSADSGPGTREVARRLFAAEFDDATLSYSESDEERAPNYVVTPTGARVNRLFAVGVLTEVEQVNEDSLRGRVVDPTGPFVTYAGQYQPDEHAFLNRVEPPMFVALSGKARTFEPEDSDRVFTSVRPESINEVDADARDRWVVNTAERTLDRVAVFAEALETEVRGDTLREALEREGVDASLAAGIPKAIEHYDTGTTYLEAVRRLAVEAVEQVADERDAVGSLETQPADQTPTELGPLPETDVSLEDVEPAVVESEGEPETETEAAEEPAEETAPAESESNGEPAEGTAEPEGTAAPAAEPETTDVENEEPGEERSAAAAGGEPAETGAAESEKTETTEAAESEPSDPEASTSEPASGESASEPEEPAAGDELGDFEGDSVQETVEQESDELGDFDPSETTGDESEALTESERKEVEEEFGTEFATGSEVDEPGEAGIDVPTSEEELEELEGEGDEEPATEESEPEEPAEAPDLDLESVVVETMADMDDGDGVDREQLVAAVVDEHGLDADVVDDAIQDAMMSGKCYEPGEGTLKAI